MLSRIAHIVAGTLTALASFINPALSILLFITFLVYELDETWHISDESYRDILEYAIGLYITTTIIIALKIIQQKIF